MFYGVNREGAKSLAFHLTQCVKPKIRSPVATLLRAVHVNLCGYQFLAISLGSKAVAQFSVFAGFAVLAMFYFNGGCIMTDLEYRLDPDGGTVIDPVLAIMSLPVEKEQRIDVTVAFICLCISMSLAVYSIRFV